MVTRVTSYTLVHKILILLDFALLFLVVWLFSSYSGYLFVRPHAFWMASTLSLLLAEIGFPTVVHLHYQSFDKVLRRVTFLTLVFGFALYFFCGFSKLTIGNIVSYKAIAWVIAIMYVVLIVVRFVEHLFIKSARSMGRNSRYLAFVGDVQSIKNLLPVINLNSTSGLKLCGYFSSEADAELSAIMPYLGNYEKMKERFEVDEKISDDIYCSLPATDKDLINGLICHSMAQSTRFYYLPDFMENFGHYLVPQLVGDQIVFTNFSEPLMDPSNRLLKRAFDIAVSGVVSLFILPLIPIIALIIKIQSSGPIFFKQLRTGLNGKEFYCYKFRSMHVNKDADKLQATKDDPRKFAFGNFMRKSNIDELPQFFNVLKGDMSIVGPRPHMLAHTEEYRHKIEEYMLRHYVRPGITGWAQVTGFRGETKELWQMEGRVKRDIWYIQNWSFLLDLRIIYRTAMQVFHRDENAW